MRRAWLVWRLISAVITAAVALCLGLIEKHQWHKPNHRLVVTFVAWLVFATFVAELRGILSEIRGRRRDALRADCEVHIRSIPPAIARALVSVDQQTVGISVFKVRRPLPRVRSLERVLRYRHDAHPGESGIAWRWGKGVVGKVWKEGRPLHVDFRAYYRRHKEISREQFDDVPPTIRHNLQYDDFCRIWGKYAEVMPTPIYSRDGGEIIGVIAIDLPMEVEGHELLKNAGVKSIIETAARALARELG